MTYLDYLPATFRENQTLPDGAVPDSFLHDFLRAFETVLDGDAGLQDRIDRIWELFDPDETPAEFLPWLAGWVGLSLRADWQPKTIRGFLREVVPLYRKRGTAVGLSRILQIYLRPMSAAATADDVQIFDDFLDPPHYFQVQLTLSDANPERVRAVQEVAKAIIEQEKPAHTFYALRVVIPTMRLVSLKLQAEEKPAPPLLMLGENTWLGTGVPKKG